MRQFIQSLAAKYGHQPAYLLEILIEIQSRYHAVSSDNIELLAGLLRIPRTRIVDAVEFYGFLSGTPNGRYEIRISDCIIDHMAGRKELTDYLSHKLGVAVGGVRGDGRVSLGNTSCTGLCDQGPSGLINGYALARLDFERIDAIVGLVNGKVPLRAWPAEFFAIEDNLKKSGLLLSRPIARGGALKATFGRGLEETLAEIERSGLRGRGGAGFRTAMKWRFCAAEQAPERYVVCNADEGEPGTFKDRVLLNSFADQVFEGMTLCGALIGASKGFLYLRGEYRHLYDKLKRILLERRQAGLLGAGILGEKLNFDIEIRLGAGAYICGEESALIESLEGKSGIPRNRPPYPVTHGYLGKPTVVNNVETFFAASAISVYGGDWFAGVGTEGSTGTKLLSISGDCARSGVYEYPFGTPIRSILDDCGADDVLGLQIGGPSGTFISDRELDRQLGFDDLATGGSFMVFNKSRDVLEIARNFTHFFAHESCGFCTPCRVGTSLLKGQLDKICEGHGAAGDVLALEELARLIRTHSHCGLGQTAANPVLATLERYTELYQSRLKKISFEPGFDLDGALATARRMANRSDAAAHLEQTVADDE